MMRKICCLITLSAMLVCPMGAKGQDIKKADLAGKWYNGSAAQLRAELESYLAQAKTPDFKGARPVGFIAPHAGYAYSGPVAAYAFRAMRETKNPTVVVVGFTHRKSFAGAAVFSGSGVETPLGVLPVDRELSDRLVAAGGGFFSDAKAFGEENSVEMMLPFIQCALENPKAVLVALGAADFGTCKTAGQTLASVLEGRKDCVILGSTDMTHFLPYAEAARIDAQTVKLLETMDPEDFYRRSRAAGHQLLCGISAVTTTVLACRKLGADRFLALDLRNSGDTAGDKQSVVGYFSAALLETGAGKDAKKSTAEKQPMDEALLSKTQREKLLSIARGTIETYLKEGRKPELSETDPALTGKMGVFVTLHKHGELRGCIGNIVGTQPLYLGVRDMAVAAATEDPRFAPVREKEMKDINIEISVLTPLEKITDPAKIIMGRHGVLVRSGFHSGVYLPQVATETGWTREQFMDSLCLHKAGLPAEAWRKGGCDIYVFTAFVFGEKD